MNEVRHHISIKLFDNLAIHFFLMKKDTSKEKTETTHQFHSLFILSSDYIH